MLRVPTGQFPIDIGTTGPTFPPPPPIDFSSTSPTSPTADGPDLPPLDGEELAGINWAEFKEYFIIGAALG